MNSTQEALQVRPLSCTEEFERLDQHYQTSFGESSIPTELLASWWRVCPSGLQGLFRNSHLIGGFSIWPLDDLSFEALSRGVIRERDIRPSSIQAATPNQYYWSEIIIQSSEQGYPALSVLLRGLLSHLLHQGEFPLRVLALAYSAKGERMLTKLGFIQRLDPTETLDQLPLLEWVVPSKDTLVEIIASLK